MNPQLAQLQEAARQRFGGAGQSNVGTIPNNPSASNPLASRQNMQQGGNTAMPSAQNPQAGAIAAMNGSMPMKGGTFLEKALTKRLALYPPA